MSDCPLCGIDFEPNMCRSSCPMARGCAMQRCPRCGYEFVEDGIIARLLRRVIRRNDMSRLTDVKAGSMVTITRVDSKAAPRLQRLASFGIVPGMRMRLVAKKPTFVLECEHTSLAIDGDVAGEIYVRVA
jgi:Fe2+ transport system protein FeoA